MNDWRNRAACRGRDPELWWPVDVRLTPAVQEALTICAECPVREQCLAWAYEQGEQYGIWGGLTEQARSTGRPRTCRFCGNTFVPRRKRADRPQEYCTRQCAYDDRASNSGCGTLAGSARHRRAGEPECEPCRMARRLYDAQRQQQRRRERRETPRWTPEQVAAVKRLAATGADDSEIAAAVGRTVNAVRLTRNRHRIPGHHPRQEIAA